MRCLLSLAIDIRHMASNRVNGQARKDELNCQCGWLHRTGRTHIPFIVRSHSYKLFTIIRIELNLLILLCVIFLFR
jgi:hypothetical protein